MLWCCIYLPLLPIELREPRDAIALAIVDQHGSRRRLIACNEIAREAGLHNGMDATTALGRLPSLQLIKRSQAQERHALKALAAWSQQFSGMVSIDHERWMIWIEIGASLTYFHGMKALAQKISSGIDALGYSAMTGIAPTPEAAALLARHAHTQPIQQLTAIKFSIAALPLSLLAVSPIIIEALHGVGWKQVGDIMEVPFDQLARRFGPAMTKYLHQLLGELPDPRVLYRVPASYHRHFELSATVDAIEALLFPLRRMLGELQGYLRARDTALQQLKLTLIHENKSSTILEVRTTAPQRDAQSLLVLLRETLERTTLPTVVVALTLTVDQFVSLGDTQLDFFTESKSRDQSWSALLDKLRARLGEQSIKRLGLNDHHLPEKAWCKLCNETKQQEQDDDTLPQRPLWLIEPKLLQTLPRLLGKPERIESGWWTGEDSRRDYYIAETQEGARWWLYRDAHSQQWYLHGLWA